ncbi:hypothetical protein [Microvirga arsenatis]|uniref:Transposase n=1 Tax=Microvirga arsenatis TaxID=2692265 RepID=A0ABW9Z3Q1_9HYPH|nr:hypothetical protein [Microvirga arsenatis]NBJ13608.1 hypothetical protein [Microvirga arsenatis]NBJ27080.1 hypothetical protein [Microvirga arsenatis]
MLSVQHLASASSLARDCTYNLFRNKQRSALLCAVPVYRPVPTFLSPEQWIFERPLQASDYGPPGFEDRAASVGVRFNGFYLFQVTASQNKIAA